MFGVTGCSGQVHSSWHEPPATAGSATAGSAAAGVAGPDGSGVASGRAAVALPLPSSVIVNQSTGNAGERRLAVTETGDWTCDNCTGDGRTTAGRLGPDPLARLAALITDPALPREAGPRAGTAPCRNQLSSNLVTRAGVVTWSTCAGPGPVSTRILRLLADATRLDPGLPR